MNSEGFDNSVLVSYHASPSADVWERIQGDLRRQLPLKNLEWKSGSRQNRVITSIEVSFQPFRFTPASNSSNPLVYLIFVACDDHEAYKTVIKQEIRSWLDLIQANQSEWLIVHVTASPKATNTTSGIFRTKAGVLDRLRSDFNPPKKERCIQLNYLSTMDAVVQSNIQDSTTQWTELIARLKDSLMVGFDSRVSEIEDSLRALDSKRGSFGWEFKSYFIQKISLANQFEAMKLLEDSLAHYSELDESLAKSLQSFRQEWSSKIEENGAQRDSRSLLMADISQLHLQISRTTNLSIFDMKTYLFYKQINLLAYLRKLEEAMQRASVFVTTFAAFLRSHQNFWPNSFVECWIYCSCTDLVEWCEKQTRKLSKEFERSKTLRICAQLLELANNQLDKIGIQLGYLPSSHPFTMSLLIPDSPTSEIGSISAFTNTKPDLMDGVKSSAAFEKLYIATTNKAINLYQLHGRRRSGLKLHCKLASLEHHLHRYESAQRLYSHLPSHYVDDRWSVIESSLLSKCSSLQKALGLSRDCLLSTLALVRSGISNGQEIWSQEVLIEKKCGDEDARLALQMELAQTLVKDIREQSLKLEKDFAAIRFPTFSISIDEHVGSLSEESLGSIVEAKVTNLLPCPVKVDAVRMKLSGKLYETLWFTTGYCQLESGQTTIRLFCPTPVDGDFKLDVSQIRISRIIFQYFAKEKHQNQPLFPSSRSPQLITFVKDPLGMDVRLRVPEDSLGSSNAFIVSFSAGRNDLSKVLITFASDLPMGFILGQSTLCDSSSNMLRTASDSSMELCDVKATSQLKIRVPYSDSVAKSSAQINISIEYRTNVEPDLKRIFKKTCTLVLTPPVRVSVQNNFRPQHIFSVFTLRTDGRNPLRICKTSLEPDALDSSGLSVESILLPGQKPTTVLPSQTSKHVFKLFLRESPQFSELRLRLVIKYRLIIDEILDCLQPKLSQELSINQTPLIPYLLEYLRSLFVNNDFGEEFYHSYLNENKIQPEFFSDFDLDEFCDEFEKDKYKKKELVDQLSSALQTFSIPESGSSQRWNTFTVSLSLPSISIFTTITYDRCLRGDVRVGDSINVILKFTNSFRWCRAPSDRDDLVQKAPKLIYEINPQPEHWLISGCKRGTFFAEESSVAAIELIFVPLKAGYVNFPEVLIKILPKSQSDKNTRIGDAIKSSDLSVQTHHTNIAEPILVLPTTQPSSYLIKEGLENY
ncbi:trafficking protein particle complex subunit 10 [Phakopsora pachyrhizi]|nr:trafficking protein particle complex subunit 10 [Phakopsora pachyrhizi]